MTWARSKTTGHGALSWAVAIDGLPYVACSSAALAAADTTDSLGRTRYVGLKSDGLKFSERVHLPTAAWEADGLQIKLADVNGKWTELFTKQPTAITNLSADWTAGTTITVDATADFAASGEIYIGFQTVNYTAKGGGGVTFTGCSGQYWNTPPLKHYIATGEHESYVEVTNWPRSIEGRRVRVYAFGSGELSGNGTQVWVGVARTEPKWNGTEWSFRVDPLSAIFDCEMNQDLEKPYNLRGIYYSWDDPLCITFEELSTASDSGSVSFRCRIAVCGFWETQQEFCTALTAHIQARLAAASFTQTGISAVTDGATWMLQHNVSVANARYVRVVGGASSFWDRALPGFISSTDGGFAEQWASGSGALTGTVAVSGTYSLRLRSDDAGTLLLPGTMPRGSLGYGPNQPIVASFDVVPEADRLDVDYATNPPLRLYLSDAPLASANFAMIEWEANGLGLAGAPGGTASLGAECALDTADNFVDLSFPSGVPGISQFENRTPLIATGDNPPEIRLGRSLGTGNLADFLSTLQSSASDYVNKGGWPFIHQGSSYGALADIDITTSNTEIDFAAGTGAIGNGRTYSFFAPRSLRELIEMECRLIGVYPCLNSSGQIVFRRLRLPAPSEAGSNTLTKADIVISDNTLMTFERSPFGIYNTVELQLGYDPASDEQRWAKVIVRDVQSYSMQPMTRVLKIVSYAQDPNVLFGYDDAVEIAAKVLSVFGAPYTMLTVQVPLTKFEYTLGSVVTVTWRKLPNADGTIPKRDDLAESKLGLIIGRQWEPREGKGTLTMLLTDQRIAGYAPGGKITSISGASGTTGPFTVTLSSDYFPSGTEADDFFEAGDAIRVFRWNSTSTTGNFTDTIDSVSGNTVTFTTAAAWTHAAITWALGAQISTSISEANQKFFAYIARSDGRVEWAASDFDPAFTLS